MPPTEKLGTGWRVIDLCCGLGGISLAARSLGCEIAAGVDISKSALETFKKHFPEASSILGSISRAETVTALNATINASSDQRTLVVSGPPCQGFSVAGARVQRDPRNRILPAVGRAIAQIQPTAALIENVAAILSDRHKRSVSRFLKIVSEAGYKHTILRMNAADYGVPQVRHRVFFLITRKSPSSKRIQYYISSLTRPKVSVREALSGLASPPVYSKGNEIHDSGLQNHIAMRHSLRVREKISAIKPGSGPMSYRRLHPDRPARTLISGNRAPPAHFEEPRSITVREAARLQGFPDNFEVLGCFSKQMQLVTNAVPPPLARAALITLFMTMETTHGRTATLSDKAS
ncbi:DNA cytosine methyltransferase [Corallococcus macrosporus]